MQNKKIGVAILILTFLVGAVMLNFMRSTQVKSDDATCLPNKECANIAYSLNMSNLGIGFLFGLLFLGLYLIVFDRNDVWLKQLNNYKHTLKHEDKLKVIHMMLTQNERKVFDSILEQEGITQDTLRIRADLSKSTVSEILTSFEKKGLIRRIPKGKTYSIFLSHKI